MTAPTKYTSLDVRDDERLRPLAHEYLLRYNGEFAFLRDAKRKHMAGEFLHEAVIKGVLNCMLADPRVGEMPQPTMRSFVPSFSYVGSDNPDEYAPIPIHRRTKRDVRRSTLAVVDTSVRIKYPFVTSLHKQGLKVHFVDERQTAYLVRSRDSISIKARCVCGSAFPAHSILLGMYEAVELLAGGERQVCEGCERVSGQTLMSTLTDYESSLIRATNPSTEYITRNELPNP